MIVYDDVSENKITIFDKKVDKHAILGENMDFDNSNIFSFNHRSGKIAVPNIRWEEPLKKEIQHFIDCIINNTPCLTDAKHAEKVVKILEMSN